MPPRRDVVERFRERVQKTDGCWLWTGDVARRYGRITIGQRAIRAHRFSYELHVGRIPKGMMVCHRCDVPLCVNPDHLFLGSAKDNMKDAVDKRRHAQSRKTHCRHGHEYTPENTRWRKAHGSVERVCKTCYPTQHTRRRIVTGVAA